VFNTSKDVFFFKNYKKTANSAKAKAKATETTLNESNATVLFCRRRSLSLSFLLRRTAVQFFKLNLGPKHDTCKLCDRNRCEEFSYDGDDVGVAAVVN